VEDWTDEFDRHIREAQARGYEPEASGVLEEAVRLADRNNDDARGLLARYLYVFSVAPLDPQRALVEFAWCASHQDIEAPFLPPYAIPQLYGIAVGILRSYPDYSLEQIEHTFTQMEQAFAEAGLDERDIFHHRIYASLGTGRRDEAAEWYRKWRDTPPRSRVCDACERGTRVLFHMHGEHYDEALDLARPLLNGELGCDDGQPLTTYSATLIPLVRLGRIDEASVYYRASRQLLEGMGYAALWSAGRQLSFAAFSGQLDDARQLFETWAPRAYRHGTATDRFGFVLAGYVYSRALALAENERVALTLPDVDGAPPVSDGTVSVRLLTSWFDRQVRDLADRFDARNGNGEYTRIAGLFRDMVD
jgi:hypothetical protein